ncbi:MAG: hypothetical protein Q9213_002780 [Squamulea squamosa]
MRLPKHSWQVIARAKVADLESRIPKEWVLSQAELDRAKQQRDLTGSYIEQYLNDHEVDIIRNGSLDLVEKIKSKQYTAVEVTHAFCKITAVAQQINNCLHEIMFDFAMRTAEELDEHLAIIGTVKGPLHGLPVSLKDQFHVKGYDTSMGYVGWIGTHEGSRDPELVHKVNSQFVDELNSLGANPGQDTYASSVGVMGTSVDALKLVVTSILSLEPWIQDPNVVKMPWNRKLEHSTLARAHSDGSAMKSMPFKFGMFWNDGCISPHPPVARGLRYVYSVLKGLGHKIIDWEPPSHATAQKIHLSFLGADGAHDIHRQLDLSGEPLIPPLREGLKLRDPLPLLEYQDMTLQGKKFCEAYTDYWNSSHSDDGQVVDAVIMPVAPHAAVIPGKFYHEAYTESINLLEYSVVVIPVTKADKSIDKYDHTYQPLNEADRKNWEAYDPEAYDGAPVGLQIVARKWEEEKVWAIAKIIDLALRTRAR